MMPRDFEVILASICAGSRFQMTGSTSTKTGLPPQKTTALALAIKVSVGTMTSSPGSKPSAINARCNDVVPLEQLTAYFVPQNLAKPSSNCSIYLPVELIQVDCKQSITYFCSLPPSVGAATGMKRFSLPLASFRGLLMLSASPLHPASGDQVRASNPIAAASDLLHSVCFRPHGDKRRGMPWLSAPN